MKHSKSKRSPLLRRCHAWPAVLCCALSTACAGDLQANDEADVMDVPVDGIGGPNVRHIDEGEGVRWTAIDAASDTAWVYVSLVDGAQLDVTDPLTDESWDLAFQRFHIATNGGSSGPAGHEAAVVPAATLEDVEVPPADGYVADAADGDDDDDDPDYALAAWYDYDVMTHVLTPVSQVYVVRTGDERYYGIEIVGYYDDAGTSGHPSLRWRALDAP